MSTGLKNLLKRAETWPEAARYALIQVADEIERELDGEYHATPDELRGIDRGLRAVESGQIATAEEVAIAFEKFRAV